MLIAIGMCAAAGIALAVLRSGDDPVEPHRRSGSTVSFALMCVWTVASSLNLQRRVDGTELFSEGLSTQNRVQAGVTLVLAAWAFVLVTSRRVRLDDLVRGGRLWITALLGWFAITTWWATSPVLSRYRVVELVCIWVIVTSAMEAPARRSRLVAVLWTTIATGVIAAVLSEGTFDIVRSNSLAPIAALLGLLGLDSLLRHGVTVPRLVSTAMPLWLFWEFDSLATAGALLVAVGAFFVGRAAPGISRMVAALTIAVGGIVALLAARADPTNVVEGFGAAYGKPQQFVSNWTGRLPLWEFMIADIREHPLGLGLAADRTLVLRDTAGEIGWAPLHAHNGFMAALYGGGFVGMVLAIAVLGTAVVAVRRLPPSAQAVGHACLALLAINNLTINGFGATMSPSWLVMMTIVASGGGVFVDVARVARDDARGTVPPAPHATLVPRYRTTDLRGAPESAPRTSWRSAGGHHQPAPGA